jgi:hypothetical protein
MSNCDPTMGNVDGSCGVFVSSSLGDDGDAGTKTHPVASIGRALAIAGAAPTIYVCGEAFSEDGVTLPSGATLYGALKCSANWAYDASTPTTLTSTADQIPLRFTSGSGRTAVFDLAVTAPDATLGGGSSIAALVEGGAVELTRMSLTAGAGMKGDDGTDADPTAPATPANGNNGKNACSGPEPIGGGAQVTNTCGAKVSIGGRGGDGNDANGGNADDGQPLLMQGQGGEGEPTAGIWTCAVGGANGGGNAGDNGGVGDVGSAGTGTASLTSSGYAGIDGGPGGTGHPGQGGGGGGGAKGGATLCSGNPGAGASGGSGGMGGCGGAGGGGGKAGGASLALVSLGARITLTDCTLAAGVAGDGGQGGDAQPGASGGAPGSGGAKAGVGSNNACNGGQGGSGGDGASGGGGQGAPSLGIAFTGAAPTRVGNTTVAPGTAGAGGLGGDADVQGNHGDDGVALDQQSFGG